MATLNHEPDKILLQICGTMQNSFNQDTRTSAGEDYYRILRTMFLTCPKNESIERRSPLDREKWSLRSDIRETICFGRAGP
jgi:hypothetical protein